MAPIDLLEKIRGSQLTEYEQMVTVRHFTATGFVISENHLALHWHPKVKAWLPPGGHIETNEDPVQAVLREIKEESGLDVEIIPTGSKLDLDYPKSIMPPFTIMIEDINDPIQGYHQHIDMIYFCKSITKLPSMKKGWHWINRSILLAGESIEWEHKIRTPPPKDVRNLAEKAFSLNQK